MALEFLPESGASPAAYLEAARAVQSARDEALVPLRVSVVASFTADVLGPYLTVEGARRGLGIDVEFGPYGQLEQQLLDAGSPTLARRPDVVVVATRAEEVAPALLEELLTMSADDVAAEVAAVGRRITALLEGARARTDAALLVFNHAPPRYAPAGVADGGQPVSIASAIAAVNDAIARACAAVPGCFVFDLARVAAEIGLARWSDARLAHLGRIPFSAAAQQEIGRALARRLRSLRTPPRKCLVLDLDNTLWGGVLGEDGPGGIKLGADYPGNVFSSFQRHVKRLRSRGVLLAVASKNNPADALEVLDGHPDCVLRTSDFAALQIGWEDKATSLLAIARELNIGIDALAFFDDNPVEREWVRSQLPQVAVVEVPASPTGYIEALEAAELFDHPVLTEEDGRRADLYRAERQRREAQVGSGSVEEFLRSLEMSVAMGEIDDATLPRVAQLLQKTNQFNLTTRRHTASEVAAMLADGAIGVWMRVADRFGDNGLVGVALATPRGEGVWDVDSFLLSCRVIGRRLEACLLAELARLVAARGGQTLVGHFVASEKNAVAARMYPELGFEPAADGSWRWNLFQGLPLQPDFVYICSQP